LAGGFSQLAPVAFIDSHAELFRSSFDTFPGIVPLGVAHALDLGETRNRVADVGCILKRLLALPWKGELPVWQFIAPGLFNWFILIGKP